MSQTKRINSNFLKNNKAKSNDVTWRVKHKAAHYAVPSQLTQDCNVHTYQNRGANKTRD